MNNLTKTASILLLLLVAFSCTVQKSRKEISGVKKFYHNTTAKYNGYYNATVLLDEAIQNLESSHQDNYNKVLELYPFMGVPDAKSVETKLDEVMTKVSVVVNLHRVSDWTDDCYLLLGQSQFVKRNFEDAQQTFEFMKEEFDPANISKERKKALAKLKKKRKKGKKGKKKKRPGVKGKKKSTSAKSKGKKKKKKSSANSGKKKKRPSANTGKKKKRPTTKSKPNKKPETTTPKKVEEQKTIATKVTAKKPSAAKKKKAEEDEIEIEKDRALHRPVWQDGKLWLAITYIQRGMYSQADFTLESLEQDPKTQKEVRKELSKVRSLYYLRQKKYVEAIDPLTESMKLSKDRSEKARMAYILGQLSQKAKRTDVAFAYFNQASKLSLNYELAFSAKLQMAQNEWLSGKASADQALSALKRMSKDDKNREYKDQVYFAMGSIALEGGKKQDATQYFKKSLAEGTSNISQKAESYLALAHLFNESEDFVNAKNYFDSTMTVLPKTDDRVPEIVAFQDNLEDIKKNIEIINLQDSLLRISEMSVEDQNKVAVSIKAHRDSMALASAQAKINGGKISPIRKTRSGSQVDSKLFWPYDAKLVKKGRRDFEKRYGDRVLEDNWRRKNRLNASSVNQVFVDNEVEKSGIDQNQIDEILKGVPRSGDQIKAARKKIASAMIALGRLYIDKLNRNDLSIEILERLSKEYPRNPHEAEGWYNLYLAYARDNAAANKKLTSNKILNQYPNSVYAKILGDPDYLNKANVAQMDLSNYYDVTYAKFVSHDYETVNARIAEAKTKFPPPHTLQAKFALLSAMTQGHIQGKDAYVKALKEVIAQYPKTDEEKRAKEILRLLGEGRAAGVATADAASGGNFVVNMEQVHYFVVKLKNNSIKLTDAKAKASDYHREFHSLDKLRISNIYLGADTSTPILVIRRFKTGKKAMDYYEGIISRGDAFLGPGVEYELFPISQSNYRQVLKDKSLDAYAEFFKSAYK